jgi:hypothetical protein
MYLDFVLAIEALAFLIQLQQQGIGTDAVIA